MKILFLDHQGVMYTKKHPKPGTLDDFDTKAVQELNTILEADPTIEIVVSSDWKYWVDLKTMGDFYEKQGIRKRPIDYTPKTPKYGSPYELYRAREIQTWQQKNPSANWVAVDDLDMRPYLENFVWIHEPSKGLLQVGARDQILCFLEKIEIT